MSYCPSQEDWGEQGQPEFIHVPLLNLTNVGETFRMPFTIESSPPTRLVSCRGSLMRRSPQRMLRSSPSRLRLNTKLSQTKVKKSSSPRVQMRSMVTRSMSVSVLVPLD